MVPIPLVRIVLNFDTSAVLSLDSNAFGEGAVLGCDFAGRVSRIGPDVTSVKTGDRISGFIWGGIV
jgi:NADPH:quinone reductase-like Zn-dependent oxidoreductase